MSNEIELVSDGEGMAVFGPHAEVERFLSSAGLPSRELSRQRLGAALQHGSAAAQAASEIAANSGRWVKLTKESAEAMKKYGLVSTKTPGVSHAMVGKPGEIKRWLQIAKGPGSKLTNPANLANAAAVMSQMAMQQQMDEITDYLKTIDQKLDTVLRSQTNQVLARMDGVSLAIMEANSIRESVGRVSEVTWSKVQGSAVAIHETEGYALRQLADLVDKIEQSAKFDDLADSVEEAKPEIQKWLLVLARCFQLHDAVAVLELERVLDADPDELDRHRLGLKAARGDRLALISQSTERLLERMLAAAGTANSKVLLHPAKAPAVVETSHEVTTGVEEFHGLLGIESGREYLEARRWVDAAAESWDKALEVGAGGVDTVKRFGSETVSQARLVKGKVSDRLGEKRNQKREEEETSGP